MKKTIAIVLSLLFILAVASVTFATDTKEAATEKKTEAGHAAKAEAKHVTGEVTAVDVKAGTITVKGEKGDVTVKADAKTHIMIGKDKKSLADIKAGDKVTVKYHEADGKNTAVRIEEPVKK
jgi:Cu/Ag efflux protein CusF